MPDLDAIRARAEESFLVGSHGTAAGVWFADVTEEDVREDARNTLALLAEIERLREALTQLARDDIKWRDADAVGAYRGHISSPAAVREFANAALAAQPEAQRTKEPSECAREQEA